MTASTAQPRIAVEPAVTFEVSTVAADTLRAGIRVSGTLRRSTVAPLICVLHTHLAAGRRYLRVDLADADIADDTVLAALVDCHERVSELGGMLAFEHANAAVMLALRSSTLFVRAADA